MELEYKYELSIYKNGRSDSDFSYALKALNLEVYIMENF